MFLQKTFPIYKPYCPVMKTIRYYTVTALPYLYYPSADSSLQIEHRAYLDGYVFPLHKKRDAWMVGHDIPVVENLIGSFQSTLDFDSVGAFLIKNDKNSQQPKSEIFAKFKQSITGQKRNVPFVSGIIGFRTFTVQPGESTSFRINLDLCEAQTREPKTHFPTWIRADKYGDEFLENLIKADEEAYSKIPKIGFLPLWAGIAAMFLINGH